METNVVCPCQWCGKRIEFDSSLFQAGSTIICPHCGEETMATIPTTPTLMGSRTGSVIVTTGNEISGRTIEGYIGVARGIVVRSPDIIQGTFGQLKQIVGGNIESYASICEETRKQAFDRMIEQAKAMCADAVIAFRYDATEFAPGVAEVLAYGTAVKLTERS